MSGDGCKKEHFLFLFLKKGMRVNLNHSLCYSLQVIEKETIVTIESDLSKLIREACIVVLVNTAYQNSFYFFCLFRRASY